MKTNIKKIGLPLLVASSLLFALTGKAQITFQKVYPSAVNQSTRDVLATNDGGYLIAGMTENQIPGDSDIYIIKTNSTGDTMWTKLYGGTKSDYPYSLIETNDGNYFILGYTASYGAGDYDTWLIKMSPSGETLWSKTYGGAGDDEGKEIIPTADGNYMIVGHSNSPNPLNTDVFLMKIDPAGTQLSIWYYGGPQYDTGHSVKQCADGGYIFVGQTLSYGPDAGSTCTYCQGNIYLVRTKANGDTMWTRTFGGINFDEGKYVLTNTDGTFTLCANDSSTGHGDLDIQVIKTDANGDVLWNNTYGGTKKDVCKRIEHTSDGGYVISGVSRSFGWINPDMWVVKLAANGDTMWTRHYGSWYHDHCYAIKQVADGGYIAVGHQEDMTSITHVMFLKLNSEGNLGPASIREFAANTPFQIYPNPSKGKWTITNTDSKIDRIEIRDILGNLVYSESIGAKENSYSETIDLPNESPGIYFLRILSEGSITTKKLILD